MMDSDVLSTASLIQLPPNTFSLAEVPASAETTTLATVATAKNNASSLDRFSALERQQLSQLPSPQQVRFCAMKLLHAFERSQRHSFKADELLDSFLESPEALAWTDAERSILTQLVYGTLRCWNELGHWIEHLTLKNLKQTQPVLRTWLRLGLYQLRYLSMKPHAVVHETLEAAKYTGISVPQVKFLNALLRNYDRLQQARGKALPLTSLLADPPQGLEALALNYGWPRWLLQLLHAEQSDLAYLEQLIQASRLPAPWGVRVHTHTIELEQYIHQLEALGLEYVQPFEEMPCTLVLSNYRGRAKQLPGFEQGEVYVQDLGSAWLAHEAYAQPGMRVLDLCAAPGSKTFYLANQMQHLGELWSVDISGFRLRRVRENAERLKVDDGFLHIVACDGREFQHPQGALFDVVVVDAPCSGMGTLRRHPEILLHREPEHLEQYTTLQLELLIHALGLLKPQGRLIYGTCSVLPQENREVLALLQKSHGHAFELESQETLWPSSYHDGFYRAVLVKKAETKD
ncbi:MAG: transcription antitermination factor NusB [Vampirovibrionales bacterium]